MSKLDIYIGTGRVDFAGELNVKRQVSDYRDLDIGSINKSYTLDLPLTNNNISLLKRFTDIRSREEVTDVARIYSNGVEIIAGKLRILSGARPYVRAIIDADDWAGTISGVSIKDLSWVSGDQHTFNNTNILGSWTAAAGAFYRYPLINFGELVSEGFGLSGTLIYPYDLYPMWQIETIVTKIINAAGYALDASGFFSQTFGRALYLLSAPKPNEQNFITQKELSVYVDDTADNYDDNTIGGGSTAGVSFAQVLVCHAETTDEGADYSTASNKYTVPETGTYRFQAQITVFCTFNDDPDDDWNVVSNSLDWNIRKNGGPTIITASESGATLFNTGSAVFTLDTGYIHLVAGDYIEVYVDAQAVGQNKTGGSLTAYLYLMDGAAVSFFNCVWSEQNLWPGIGKTIGPGEYLPDMDCIDFLKGLKQAFNLRFWIDVNNKKAYIATSNDFYGTTVIDWTDKIDYSSMPQIDAIVSNYNRVQWLKWIGDEGDAAFVNYVSANGEPYTKKIELDSEYALPGSNDRINNVFASTILGEMLQVGHWQNYKVPRIFGAGEFVSDLRPYPAIRSNTWTPRILQWMGMVDLTVGNFNWAEDVNDTSPTNYTTFPSVQTPDMSDMYDDYLLKDWRRIEKNKLVTCTVKIPMSDWVKFNTVVSSGANEGFRATYKLNIEGVDMYFLLTKITTNGDLVKCEFVQKM